MNKRKMQHGRVVNKVSGLQKKGWVGGRSKKEKGRRMQRKDEGREGGDEDVEGNQVVRNE